MAKYRKKPVVIEAEQHWFDKPLEHSPDFLAAIKYDVSTPPRPYIHTLEGIHAVSHGDFVIKGVNGEFYPCKPDIFDKTYESV